MAVEATYTKDIHYSGIITVDGETVVSMDANMDAKHPDVPSRKFSNRIVLL